jgi:hypothetical protein
MDPIHPFEGSCAGTPTPARTVIVKGFHGVAEADHRWIGRSRLSQEPDRIIIQ